MLCLSFIRYPCFVIVFSHSVSAMWQDALRAADLRDYSLQTQESLSCWNPDCIGFHLIEYLLCYICENERPGAVLVFMTGWDDISGLKDKPQAHSLLGDSNRVLLLACHGSMPSSEQVFLFIYFIYFFIINYQNCILICGKFHCATDKDVPKH